MSKFLCSFLEVYIVVLIARALLSWFPISPRSFLAPVQRVLFDVTEPVLAPVRRIIPPAGNFDLSFLVVFFVITIVQRSVCNM